MNPVNLKPAGAGGPGGMNEIGAVENGFGRWATVFMR